MEVLINKNLKDVKSGQKAKQPASAGLREGEADVKERHGWERGREYEKEVRVGQLRGIISG